MPETELLGTGEDTSVPETEPISRAVHPAYYAIITLLVTALIVVVTIGGAGGNFAQAAENLVRNSEIASMQAYIDEHKGELSAHEQSLTDEEYSRDAGFTIAATDSEDYLDLMFQANGELAYLPDYIKEKFASDGWSFVVTSEDLDASYAQTENKLYEPGDEIVLGLTRIDEKTVSIRPESSAVASSCLHEMGHYIDYSLGYVSHDREFSDAAEADRDSFTENFAYNHLDVAEEMYAEAFKAYWKSPEKLKENCPAIYEYFTERF